MKRWLAKIVAFLLLGAIVNVAVTWGCAYWMDRRFTALPKNWTNYGPWRDDQFLYSALVYRQQGRVIAVLSQKRSEPFVAWDSLSNWPPQLMEKGKPPTWSAVGAVVGTRQPQPQEIGNTWRYRLDLGLGWPCSAMRYRIDLDDSLLATVQLSNGFSRSHANHSLIKTGELPLVVPLRPIWSGFAINTIFYAAMMGGLTLGPFTARRLIRRKRGRCIKCGYDLRGDFSAGCPECGWRRVDVS